MTDGGSEFQMAKEGERFNKILLSAIGQLQLKLPSRRDPVPMFLARSAPHVRIGFGLSVIFLILVPYGYLFPKIWAYSLFYLPNWFEILVYFLLTVIMVWTFCYAVGVLFSFLLRHTFHYWLRKRIARQAAHSSANPIRT